MISINNDLISHIDSSIPSYPKRYREVSGAQLPNSGLVICGGEIRSNSSHQYLHYKDGSIQWTKVGTMKKARYMHSSVWIDGRLLTTGGWPLSAKTTSHHEEFSFDGGVKEREEMPIALAGHTATIIEQNKMIVCGGRTGNVSKTFS